VIEQGGPPGVHLVDWMKSTTRAELDSRRAHTTAGGLKVSRA